MLSRPWRYTLLIMMVVISAASVFVSFQRHAEATRILSEDIKTSSWAAAQLEIDYLHFQHNLAMYSEKLVSKEDMLLTFDLLWSRVNILSIGKETLQFRQLEGSQKLLTDLKGLLHDAEPTLVSNEQVSPEQARQIRDGFARLFPSIRLLHVQSYNGSERMAGIDKAHLLELDTQYFMLGLLGSGAFLVFMIFRESSKNRHLAMHDALTRLPNRVYFKRSLEAAAQDADKSGLSVAVHIVDLNNFKEINDVYGHAVGDAFLIKVAERLQGLAQGKNRAARLGGDEFALIQGGIEGRNEAEQRAWQICEVITEPLMIQDIVFYPRASVGVSLYPDDDGNITQTQLNADVAMYQAKSEQGMSYRFFDAQMNEDLKRRKQLADALEKAINNNQLNLLYQPIFNMTSGKMVGVEALVRWHSEEFGTISPEEIVTTSEQAGLANIFNHWVLTTACKQAVAWHAMEYFVAVSVNISPSMYTDHDLVSMVEEVLESTQLQSQYLMLEVTEDTTMQDIESSPHILRGLSSLGVSLALDDFGTGYSSLSHLKSLPVQRLKIDKSFIQDLFDSPSDLRFITTILQLAESLGLNVVAEGIELDKQRIALISQGCVLGQGYLFSRPVSADSITQLLIHQSSCVDKLQGVVSNM
ncbi:putative bifunctional diguanylate cyclase/phosphodiesterase [Neptunomonas phycophila]|uniref:putative bifunctional diguanylate cyclase/phosphodiesterase n=1 Tax=Neptunomonas phycophila TaxID=1572645 RepID=UPI000948A5E5|nr:EAL domain-containing protein [Neptunomonas phycophila]